jgi:hypothetical protein
MKFTKNLPKEDGYYWYIYTEYPLPKIVWYSNYYKKFWDWGRETIPGKYCRFGDRVEQPILEEIENEY